MQLKNTCAYCNGTGKDTRNSIPPMEYTCVKCDGVVFFVFDIIGSDFADILDKIQEIKTKASQMQADINYIKAKVG
jgi:hypothetical protein